MARPKKTLSDLPEGWEKETLELYKEGGSDIEVRASILDISQDLWERFIKEEPSFSLTIKRGRALSESWWIKNGRSNLKDKEFNYTGWYMNMKNRFKWKDKHDVTTDGKEVKGVVYLPARNE